MHKTELNSSFFSIQYILEYYFFHISNQKNCSKFIKICIYVFSDPNTLFNRNSQLLFYFAEPRFPIEPLMARFAHLHTKPNFCPWTHGFNTQPLLKNEKSHTIL